MKSVFAVALWAVAMAMASAHDEDVHIVIDAGLLPQPQEPFPVPAHPFRSRRQACGTPTQLTSAQVAEALNLHNSFRSMEPSSNEFKMNWDVNLAAQAQAYASQCIWAHGMTKDCAGNSVGQNMYMSSSSGGIPTVNMTNAITAWYNERQWWNSTSGTCMPNKVCGHWTQVVWSNTATIGCGYQQCPVATDPATGNNVKNALIVVCDYSNAGNWVGQLPYKIGEACSTCSSNTRTSTTNPGYTCSKNQCTPCSPTKDEACECGEPDSCSGQGTWQPSTCSCQCNAGYFGPSCQNACVDASASSSCKYWQSLDYCSPSSNYYAFMKGNCVNTCKLCF